MSLAALMDRLVANAYREGQLLSMDRSTLRRIRLGEELRAWRVENNKTQIDMTRGLKGWNPGRLSRVEHGKVPVDAADLNRLLDHCGITGTDRAEIEDLIGDGPDRNWWQDHEFAETISAAFGEFLGLEAAATHMLDYYHSAFPGLLQTPDYAREMISAGLDGLSEDQNEAAAEIRILRQRRLTDEPRLDLEVYFGEVALLVAGDEEILAEQIRHVLKVSEYPNVTVRMVPLSAGRPGILVSGLTLLRFPDEPDGGFVFTEAVGGMLPRRSGRDVRRAERAFSRLKRFALSPADTISALERKLEEIT
ncbi:MULTISPECIES: helix-turn-helix transcriptional regulator [Kitasatospora]|uniref:helix-turn-helix domain-containing protein n=1 Tax=Kitasatospora TaxID=2063 RepID=UPI0005BB6B8D|nr:helix-turn-helix transcriptional regulator [Kitasatospora sp. MBT66]